MNSGFDYRRGGQSLLRAVTLSLALHMIVLCLPVGTPRGQIVPTPEARELNITLADTPLSSSITTVTTALEPENLGHISPPSLISTPGTEALPLGIDAYLASDDLDVRPVMVEGLPIDPPELRAYREGGSLVMTLLIDEYGLVNRTLLDSSDLPPAFANSTRDGMSLVRFSPGIRNGKAVKSRVTMVIQYAPAQLDGIISQGGGSIPLLRATQQEKAD